MTARLARAAPVGRDRRRGTLRRLGEYSVARGLSEALLGLRGILLATLLGPAAFGGWALVRLAMRYASLGSVGVFRGLELELLAAERHPDAAGREGPAPAALGFLLMGTGVLALLATGASLVAPDPTHQVLLRGFAAGVVLEQLHGYVLVCTRIRGDLRRYGLIELANAALQTLCALALASVWELPGALAGLALAGAGSLTLGARWTPLRPRFDPRAVRRLFSVGGPVAISLTLAAALATIDRWVVVGFGGVTLLGYYAFAASVATIAATATWVIRVVVFPEVYRRAQTAGAAKALRSHLLGAVMPVARLYPPVLGVVALLLGPIVARFMPHYLPAVAAARIFLLGGAAAGLVNLAAIGVVAAGQQRRLPALSAAALVVNLSLSMLGLHSGAGLAAVAGASLVAQTLYAVGVLGLVLKESGMPGTGAVLARTLLPLGWCTVLVIGLSALIQDTGVAGAGVTLAIYLVLVLPLMPGMRSELRRIRR